MGVRGLTRLLEDRYSSAFPQVEIGSGCVLLVDGNNWAHGTALDIIAEAGSTFEYDLIDSATRRWVESVPRGVAISFVFDGRLSDEERADKARTYASRAESRGEATAAHLYEGAAQAGPLIVEQVIATLRDLRLSVVLVDGEADSELARLCGQNTYVVSDDTDLALYSGVRLLRRQTFRSPFGIIWSRELIATALFGESKRERACIELALALGTDSIRAIQGVSSEELVAWLVRRFDAEPDFRLTCDDSETNEALNRERRRYEGCGVYLKAQPAAQQFQHNGVSEFPDELSLGAAALAACAFEQPRHTRAVERVLHGARASNPSCNATSIDRAAGRSYEYHCRDLLRQHVRCSELPLMPSKLFNNASFLAFCQDVEGDTQKLSQAELPSSASDLSAAAPVWRPSAPPLPENPGLLKADAAAWHPSPFSHSSPTELLGSDDAKQPGYPHQLVSQSRATLAQESSAFVQDKALPPLNISGGTAVAVTAPPWGHAMGTVPFPSVDSRPNSLADVDLALDTLQAHVSRLEDIIISLGRRPPPRPSLFLPLGQRLPVDAYRGEILTAARECRVVIIRGETGSGKSSVVPRFFLESSARAKVVVTQPRRLAATQLYERAIAAGLPAGLRLGMSGAASFNAGDGGVTWNEDQPHDGLLAAETNVRLWYVTAGVAAKLLSHKPRFWDDVTHLLVDEVHERDADTDVVLALSRERLRKHRGTRGGFRVILLSATLDANLLRGYFGVYQPPLVEIPGRCFELRRYYLDDIGGPSDVLAGAWVSPKVKRAREEVDRLTSKIDRDTAVPRAVAAAQLDIMEWLVRALSAGTATGFMARAIMVFVAGWSDVAAVAERFEKLSTSTTVYEVVPIHSELPFETQRAALMARSYNQNVHAVRVIVATNAAESSLTLPDVDAVIDLCSRKLPVYDTAADRIVLRHTWSSHATMAQRAGRTGRVGFGVAYHLVSSSLAMRMVARDPPQVRSQPLDQVVLGLRASLRGRRVAPIMREFPSPPSARQIADAFVLLLRRGLIYNEAFNQSMSCAEAIENLDCAPLTPAGELAAALPVDLRLSRLVMYGAAVGVLDDAVVIAAALSQPASPWIMPMPLPQLYADAADFLVLIRKALLGRQHFDCGEYSEPIALLKVVKEWRDLQTVSDRTLFCATYSLSSSRLRQLDEYAKSLASRVRSCCHEAASDKMDASGTGEHDNSTILRLLLSWVFWDQVASIELQQDDVEDYLGFSSGDAALQSNAITLGPPLASLSCAKRLERTAKSISRSQLAPLFPPVVSWELVETREFHFHATNVAECIGSRALAKEAQDELLHRFKAHIAMVNEIDSFSANFAQERLFLQVDGTLVYDGPPPLQGTQLWVRVESCGIKSRLATGIGWATITLVVDRNIEGSLAKFFGEGARWHAADSAVGTGTQQTIKFSDAKQGHLNISTSPFSPPTNLCCVGEQLVAGAVLASSAAKKNKRILRLPTVDRSGAVEVSIVRGRIAKRPDWKLVASVSGIEAPAALAPMSLEAVYWPSTRNTVAVAASMTLFASEATKSNGSSGEDKIQEEQTRARLDSVSILPSFEWMALALRAGGLRRASANLATARVLPQSLLESADTIADELLDLVESGNALRELKLGVDLGRRLERLFFNNEAVLSPTHDPPNKEQIDDKKSCRQDEIADLARRLATPHRGDEVWTPWGRGVIRVARGDGTHVVDMSAWPATCYGARVADGTLQLAARRGASSLPVLELPAKAKATTDPSKVAACSVEVVAPTSRARVQIPELTGQLGSLGDIFLDEAQPRCPNGSLDKENEDKERARSYTESILMILYFFLTCDYTVYAGLKQWILERKFSKPVVASEKSIIEARQDSCVVRSLVGPPEERLRAVIARNPSLCFEKPQVIVSNAMRYLSPDNEALDATDVARVITFAIVSATSVEQILKSPSPLSPPLALVGQRFGQAALIRGLVRYCAVDAPELVSKFPVVLKALYDDDSLEEEAIFEWSDLFKTNSTASNPTASHVPCSVNEDSIAHKARLASEPFLKWLREAEEEDDED